MELDQSQLVRIVLGRSRDLRAKAFELCAIAKDLRAAVSSRWHCPVCGSIAERYILRANLSKADDDTVLARRCVQGHVSARL